MLRTGLDRVQGERYLFRPLNNKENQMKKEGTTWRMKDDQFGLGRVATRVIDGVVEVKFPENGYDFSSGERDDMFLDNVSFDA